MTNRDIAALAALFCCTCEASAATGSGERLVQSLTRCREIALPEARLDCFDKATSALEDAVKAKEVTILDRQEIRETRKSLFGFTLPRVGLFGRGDDGRIDKRERADFDTLDTTIASAKLLTNDRVELHLADSDAVWVTTEPMPFPPKPGAKVRITAGALGNYFIAAQGSRTVRGMRVR